MTTLGSEPAYPCEGPNVPAFFPPPATGLSKRDLFAAMAMQGLLANPEHGYNTMSGLVHDATVYADALFAELAK